MITSSCPVCEIQLPASLKGGIELPITAGKNRKAALHNFAQISSCQH
jgi:hypothetical protein